MGLTVDTSGRRGVPGDGPRSGGGCGPINSGGGRLRRTAAGLLVLALSASPATAATKQKTDTRLKDVVTSLKDVLGMRENGIPVPLLADCEALVVVPGLVSGAFILGGRHGRGVVVRRLSDGRWSNPCFVSVSGASIGLQIGGQSVDLVLVVRDASGFESVLRDNFSLSGDAGITAGPVGGSAEFGTETAARAGILAYSKSKGFFAGISIKGGVLSIDSRANCVFYQKLIDYRRILFDETMPYPEEVKPLVDVLKPYAGKR